jgi:hypothetical protein
VEVTSSYNYLIPTPSSRHLIRLGTTAWQAVRGPEAKQRDYHKKHDRTSWHSGVVQAYLAVATLYNYLLDGVDVRIED